MCVCVYVCVCVYIYIILYYIIFLIFKREVILVDLGTGTVCFSFFISFVHSLSLTQFFFQHSSLLCCSRFPIVTVTVRSRRRRHRAKSLLSSLCEVVVPVRSRRPCHHAKSPRHGRVLFLCSSFASITVALCYLRCQNTWSPSLCCPHRPSLICFLHLKVSIFEP